MGTPHLPAKTPAPSQPPNLLDPTVLFARLREKNKAQSAAGRASTILASGTSSSPITGLGGAKSPMTY